MNVDNLLTYLDDCIVDKSINVDEFDYSKGLSVLMSGINKMTDCLFFVGSYLAYQDCLNKKEFIEGATYLICCDNHNVKQIPFPQKRINVIFVSTSMDALTRKVERGIIADFVSEKRDMPRMCMDFWNDVTSGQLNRYDDAITRFRKLYYPVKPHIAVILIRYDNDHMTDATFEKISKAVANYFEKTNYFFNGREWIVLYTQDKDTTEKLDFSYEDFHDMLKANSLRAAISYPCQHPELLSMMYRTTSAAFTLGIRMNIQTIVKRVYTYKELNPYLIVHLAAQRYKGFFNNCNLTFLAHPDVVTIYYHDIEENDDLLEVLNAYLVSGGSVAIASKSLYMHRNTVQNKIKKIRELIHTDIDNGSDRFLLLISCVIIKYQEQYLNENLTDFF